MNIIVITTLYPKDSKETIKTTSFAIRNLLHDINKIGICVKKVIVPVPFILYRQFRVNNKKISRIDNIDIEVRPFFNIPKYRLKLDYLNLFLLKKELKDIDLIVSHIYDGAFLANEIYKKLNIPYIYILHNSDLGTLKKQKEIISNAKGVYARSWALKGKIEKFSFKVDGVVFSGVDKKYIVSDRSHSKLDIKFISVNLLQRLKNIDITLYALARLPKELKWEYIIIGDGEEYNNLVSLIEKLELTGRVKLLGFKEHAECISYMKKSDVFIMPSSPETFGLAYLEAMASGCIVICSKGWGVDGLIKDKINGYTVKARYIDELTITLKNLFNTNQYKIYNNSLMTIQKYTLEKAQKNYADIILNSNDKYMYREFCKKEKNLPIFSQAWWLDAVCGYDNWDVVVIEKGGNIFATMPYVMNKKMGFQYIGNPILTQTLGIYFNYPKNQKYYKKLSFEKEMIEKILNKLPKFDKFSKTFNYEHTNLLPFYWKGYDIKVNYTYVIENITIEELEKNFETDIRRRRRKADSAGVEVYESEDIQKFYELNEMTFKRQGRVMPYSFEFIKNLYAVCKENNTVKMFFAKDKEDTVIACNFLLYDENTVYYLMAGINPDKKDLGGMDVVQFESIKYALQSGRKFDFEGSMIKSIEKYFRSFGAIQKPYYSISKTNSKLLKIRQLIKEIIR